MIKLTLDDVSPGDELAVDVKIHSRHPGSTYRLRIDEGTPLSEKHINRLEKAGVPYVFVKDDRTDDLNQKIIDRDLEKAEDDVLESLDSVSLNLQSDDPSAIPMDEIDGRLDSLIDALRNTKTMQVFNTLKAHHDYTVKHCLEVAKLVLHLILSRQADIHEMLLEETGATPSYTRQYMVKDIGLGALLHDIGKWKVPREVLDKRGELDLQEWNAIKKHPVHGTDIIESLDDDIRSPVLTAIRSHHEKYGGEGYPDGKLGDGIHLYGRITAVCDVFSALTSKRPYRVALTPNRAIETMRDMQRDDAHFDPELLGLFQELVPPYPIGQHVVLSNGTSGVVTELNEDWKKPTVRILKESEQELDETYELVANTEDNPSIVN
jgi:HD-GYP domain-containing protein (c-di-GMP phosphodiesterase class II)